MKKCSIILLVLASLLIANSVHAVSMLGIEPPSNLIVDRGDLEWVYAGPCAPVSPSCGVAQLHHGFVVPSVSDWNLSFTGLADLLAAFNLPGGTAPNAAPYFNTVYDHIDTGDAIAGYIWGAPFVAAYQSSEPNAEAFLVRGSVSTPEPVTLFLLGCGLVGLAAAKRKMEK